MYTDAQLGRIQEIRHFSRFYTQKMSLLQRRMLNSPYSLVEARVLYDLAQSKTAKAVDIAKNLELDAGYLSRILKRFENAGILIKEPSGDDGRSLLITITDHGITEATLMANKANDDGLTRLSHLDDTQLGNVVKAMQKIEAIIEQKPTLNKTAIIRSHRAGDIGWVVQTHGKFYADNYGFNENFEALVARIAADFISSYNSKKEHCWIAEIDGERVGSVFLVQENETTAKLRLLLVTGNAQGMGLGKRLVDECLQFARYAGYSHVELWTNDVLTAARNIYEKAGFQLLSEEEHSDFGAPQVGQYWKLNL